MYNFQHLLVLLSIIVFITMPSSIKTGGQKNYQCTKCGTLIQSDSKPSSLNCRSGGTHQWQDLGAVGTENYQCTKCRIHVESQQKPHTISCTSGGTHQWQDLGKIGSDTYQCRKCGLTINSDGKPSSLGCTNGSHQWNKLN